MIIFVYLIALAVVMIFNWGIADTFERIANLKGHSGYKGWCFWLGAIGWAMVIALPDRKNSNQMEQLSKQIEQLSTKQPLPNAHEPDDELPEL